VVVTSPRTTSWTAPSPIPLAPLRSQRLGCPRPGPDCRDLDCSSSTSAPITSSAWTKPAHAVDRNRRPLPPVSVYGLSKRPGEYASAPAARGLRHAHLRALVRRLGHGRQGGNFVRNDARVAARARRCASSPTDLQSPPTPPTGRRLPRLLPNANANGLLPADQPSGLLFPFLHEFAAAIFALSGVRADLTAHPHPPPLRWRLPTAARPRRTASCPAPPRRLGRARCGRGERPGGLSGPAGA